MANRNTAIASERQRKRNLQELHNRMYLLQCTNSKLSSKIRDLERCNQYYKGEAEYAYKRQLRSKGLFAVILDWVWEQM